MTDKNQERNPLNEVEEKSMPQHLKEMIKGGIQVEIPSKTEEDDNLEDHEGLIIPNGYLMIYEPEIIGIADKAGDRFDYKLPSGLYFESAKLSRRTIRKELPDGSEIEQEKEGFFPIEICNAFKVLAEINNKAGNDGSLILGWRNRLGIPQKIEVRAGDVHVTSKKSELFRELTQAGLEVPSNRIRKEAFEQFLLSVGTNTQKTRLEVTGWNNLNGKDYYALPIGEHFPESGEIYSPNRMRGLNAYQQKGTLEAWKNEIACYADNNRLLALGICLSFAGSLLKLANMEGGAFNFVGSSQTGKSTALKVAASVWGEPVRGGQIQSWRATDNALENIARNFNDGVLFLDEMKECAPKALSSASYMLANGCGKERMRQDSSAQDLRTWRLLFLSNGETHLKDLIEAHGGKSYAGQDVRITDISADTGKGGVFEEMYKFHNGAELAESLTNSFSENYGQAGREWIKRLTAQNLSALRANIQIDLKSFIDKTRPAGMPSGQITSVLKRFGLCAVAGELAIKWKILPWQEGTARRLMRQNAKAWLSDRGSDSGEERRILDALRRALESDENRFQSVNADDAPPNRLGFRAYDDATETVSYHLLNEGFKEIFQGFDFKLVKRILMKREILANEDLKQNRIRTKAGRKNTYLISPHHLEAE